MKATTTHRLQSLAAFAGFATLASLALPVSSRSAEAPVAIPGAALDAPRAAGQPQTAVFAGGCFWGVQAVFEHVHGVMRVLAGYSGGERATADYEAVSSGRTGHAESVRITFDPAQVTYGQLLQVAFSVAHDPTQLNRQGPDTGTQYRSAIFYGDEQQKRIAAAYIDQLNRAHIYPGPIVTRLEPLKAFYAAEDYHQDYLVHHPTSFYIVINDAPKIENLRRVLPSLYEDKPVLTSAR